MILLERSFTSLFGRYDVSRSQILNFRHFFMSRKDALALWCRPLKRSMKSRCGHLWGSHINSANDRCLMRMLESLPTEITDDSLLRMTVTDALGCKTKEGKSSTWSVILARTITVVT